MQAVAARRARKHKLEAAGKCAFMGKPGPNACAPGRDLFQAPMSLPRTSGHPLADRRFAYAMDYKAGGDIAAAAELAAQALELAPDWAAGWTALGELHEANTDKAAAIDAYRRGLALDPADTAGAGARLARLGERSAGGAVSHAHIAALFDDYAPRFEKSLLEGLHYRGPALLREALAACRSPLAFGHALDLGCGTGLAAEALAANCASMDGVDLSGAMLAEAGRKGLYRNLVQDDIEAFLQSIPTGTIDLLLAADVFVYIGDLAAIFRQAARALAPGGLFAFTVQRHDGEVPFVLGEDLRYAHGAGALTTWAGAAALGVLRLDTVSTRTDGGRHVPGLVVVLGGQ